MKKRLTLKMGKKERGFTLIELLIVIAILGVLAAVVVPNVMGLFGRGGNQAYGSDVQTIQTSVASFYGDVHREPTAANLWGQASGRTSHLFPIANGTVGNIEADTAGTKDTDNTATDAWILYRDDDGSGGYNGAEACDDAEIASAAIWMGLLINEADGAGGAAIDDDPQLAAPYGNVTVQEDSMYLTDFPKSASAENGNPDPGTYTWIVGKNGRVYGAYTDGTNWYSGFSGNYP